MDLISIKHVIMNINIYKYCYNFSKTNSVDNLSFSSLIILVIFVDRLIGLGLTIIYSNELHCDILCCLCLLSIFIFYPIRILNCPLPLNNGYFMLSIFNNAFQLLSFVILFCHIL